MITVYNETKEPWKLTELSESISLFVKKKERVDKENNNKRIVRTAGIISYKNIFADSKGLVEILEKLTQTPEPVKILDIETALFFNKKEFRPFISDKGNAKHVLLNSIFLAGKRIINVRTKDAFLMEFFTFRAEYSFIASFNSPTSQLDIELLDEEKQLITRYSYKVVNNEIKLTTKTFKNNKKPEDMRVWLKRFRPSRPTHLILVREQDKEQLHSIVSEKYHRIHVISEDNPQETIKEIINENYRAVTFYTPIDQDKETIADKTASYKFTNALVANFRIVFKLHSDLKVTKLKY